VKPVRFRRVFNSAFALHRVHQRRAEDAAWNNQRMSKPSIGSMTTSLLFF